ncbi:calcium/sodium antiporter [Kitasatospora atroaurantiaca]|uniref:Cation:H+ antiporter n=1 Tax=Kitasatospora atroaurantiaca TaxID=285545 RepID=A0A561F0H3_9ACTN|nr:sodium:calcium antiporter [Kitasatospora atroaurantiaca]TWE21366.1 cation:H+ antiporter [Kitasatospora atroaurantiaca]
MAVAVVLVLAGLVVLAWCADQLVLGAVRIGERLGLSPAFVGVVVVGIGTSLPELAVSALAAGRGETGLAVGNLVGSNILNVTLVLGLVGIVAPVVAEPRVVRTLGPLSVGAVGLFAVLVGGGLGRSEGTVLATLLVLALLAQLRTARLGSPSVMAVPVAIGQVSLVREVLRTAVGLVGTLGGAQLLVGNATVIADRMGMSQAVIGFTLVALGTSLPELVTSLQAHRRGASELLVGNLLGSNLVNSLAGGATIALATPTTAAGRVPGVGGSVLTAMALTGVLAWMLLAGGRLSRGGALVLLAVCAVVLPLLTG